MSRYTIRTSGALIVRGTPVETVAYGLDHACGPLVQAFAAGAGDEDELVLVEDGLTGLTEPKLKAILVAMGLHDHKEDLQL